MKPEPTAQEQRSARVAQFFKDLAIEDDGFQYDRIDAQCRLEEARKSADVCFTRRIQTAVERHDARRSAIVRQFNAECAEIDRESKPQ